MSHQAQRYKRQKNRKNSYAHGCTGKTRFRSLEHAKEARERIRYISVMEALTDEPRRVPVRAYFCTNCRGFHLTSKTKTRFEGDIVHD